MISLECRLFSQGVDFSNKLERGPLAEGLCVDQTSLLLLLSSFSSPSQHGENGERQSNRGTKALIKKKKKKKGKKGEREKRGLVSLDAVGRGVGC